METQIDKQFCPICCAEVKPFPRYPNYVCHDCAPKARSKDGRLLEFCNQDLSGGFLAFYAGTKEKYSSHTCYIEGVECFANEARFGGIVIQPVKEK